VVAVQLRLAAALAHTAPGVVLRLTCCNGERLTVGYARLDAQLTPCQLRTALAVAAAPGVPHLVDAVVGVEVVGGLDHIGGGLYGRGSGLAGNERWLVAAVDHDELIALFESAPFRFGDGAFAVTVAPDLQLDVTVVRIRAGSGSTAELDQLAFWTLSATLVRELERALQTGSG
jgi:hypothetical protein